MKDTFSIGVAKQGNSKFGKHKYFYIEDNKDNIYRVLPPLWSLAAEGEYSAYHASHRGLRGKDGKQKPFACIEQVDRHSKLITVACPLCAVTREREITAKTMKERGATREQLSAYRMKFILPFQVEKKYYLNVVNQNNEVGVLPISITLHKDLKAKWKQYAGQNLDLTGIVAPFLNFKKVTQFKGSSDPIYSVDIHFTPQSDGSYRRIDHTLTAEFIENRLKAETADLSDLFKELTFEQLVMLADVNMTELQRAELLDSFVSAGEKTKSLEASGHVIPGTTATMVNRVEMQGANLVVQNLGDVPSNRDIHTTGFMATESAKLNSNSVINQNGPKHPAPPVPTVSAPIPAGNLSDFTEEQFINLFAPKAPANGAKAVSNG